MTIYEIQYTRRDCEYASMPVVVEHEIELPNADGPRFITLLPIFGLKGPVDMDKMVSLIQTKEYTVTLTEKQNIYIQYGETMLLIAEQIINRSALKKRPASSESSSLSEILEILTRLIPESQSLEVWRDLVDRNRVGERREVHRRF